MIQLDARAHSEAVRNREHFYIRPGVYKLHEDSKFEIPSAPVGGFNSASTPLFFGAYSYAWSTLSRFVSSVGRYCSIAGDVSFGDDEHPISNLTTSIILWDRQFVFEPYVRAQGKQTSAYKFDWSPHDKFIEIGNDVWIGGRAYIRRGVTLEDGCIVGSNAVVTRSVPPYAVVAGNPARVVKMRFPEPIVEILLKTKWWRFDHSDFPAFDMRDIEGTCARILELEAAGQMKEFAPKTLTADELAKLFV